MKEQIVKKGLEIELTGDIVIIRKMNRSTGLFETLKAIDVSPNSALMQFRTIVEKLRK